MVVVAVLKVGAEMRHTWGPGWNERGCGTERMETAMVKLHLSSDMAIVVHRSPSF